MLWAWPETPSQGLHSSRSVLQTAARLMQTRLGSQSCYALVAIAWQLQCAQPCLWCWSVQEQLETIQSRLLDAGSAVATPQDSASASQLSRVAFHGVHSTVLEGWLDEWQKQLPPLTNFILPSGMYGLWYL